MSAEQEPQQPTPATDVPVPTAAVVEPATTSDNNNTTAITTTSSATADAAKVAEEQKGGRSKFDGMCPIKPEFRREVVQRVNLNADSATKGMNRGTERDRSDLVAGTERPTFEGEINFLGTQLPTIKAAIRQAKADEKDHRKRGREGERGNVDGCKVDPTPAPAPADAAQPVETVAADAEPSTAEVAVPAPEVDPTIAANDAEDEAALAKFREERKAAAAAVSKLEEKQMDAEEKVTKRKDMFRNKSIVAPLTTVGNLPFRRICKEFGADVTLSEMAMVFNLNNLQKSEWSLLRRHDSEDLYGIQIGVSRADDARIFAKALAASDFQYDYIDINCGCPVEQFVKRGCGCGLMAKKNRLRQVVEELVAHQPQPVTIKCRIGEDDWTLHNYIGEFEKWGASAVTIHGRTRKQRYTKAANWDYIEKCAQLTSLPVIGNGDVLAYDDVREQREKYPHITSFMSGRGALIKPWLYQEVKEERTWDISSSERFDMLKKFCDYGLKHWGADERGVLTTRRFLCEWLSFTCRYVPVGILERLPQRMNDRPPYFSGRDDLETLMGSEACEDWIKLSEMLLGPVGDKFRFTPKHKSNSYSMKADGTAVAASTKETFDDER